ncbi:MAG: hypothetical protein HC892_03865 [Saprospiraceae bacterium]|nr:hypothetical protein [Saprospiraceae bacterium]
MIYTRLISYFLSLLILLSTSGITVNRHFCRAELKDVTLFIQPASCHQEMPVDCPFHCSSAEQKSEKHEKDCCNDKSSFHKLDVLSSPDVEAEVELLLPMFDWIVPVKSIWQIQVWRKTVATHFHYRPPSINRTIFKLIQCFRC